MVSKLSIALALVLSLVTLKAAAPADADWRSYGKDPGFSHFSQLGQIDKGNVNKLKIAWIYHTGHANAALKTTIECNPLIVNGTVYVTSPVLEVIALDGVTGREIWKYNPFPFEGQPLHWYLNALGLVALLATVFFSLRIRNRSRSKVTVAASCQCGVLLVLLAGNTFFARLLPNPMAEERRQGPNRGLTYWEAGPDKRIFFAGGHRLVALDALTGKPVPNFGKNGVVNLTRGLGRNIDGLTYAVTSPGVIYKDLIIIGAKVGEGPLPAAPGHVRAYDVRTGEQKWIFHTIPYPGEVGYNTWPSDAWKRVGGSNPWGGMSVDEARGLVFVPNGAATFDFYGGDRVGKNLFSDSLVALRADSGKLVWYYQMVHHDLWDYDLPCPPNLVTLHRNGKSVDAAVQPLKNGLLFVLNRDTGKPIFPVEERPVPSSILDGEQAWPTQPFPLKPPPLARLEITEDDLTDLSPEAHAFAVRKFHEVASARIYAPPSKRGNIVTPGFHGGANWSGASFDPRTARLVINTNNVPYILQMRNSRLWQRYRFSFQGFQQFLDPEGYPAVKPPWGKLTEIDLNTGDILWQIPLGEYRELTARGIPPTGTENAGGSIITAGGLIFLGATTDRMFRAFDVDTGKVLWETELDAAAHATPSTYAVKGKQYVVVAAAGGSMVESAQGDEYVAFTLPEKP